MNEPETVSKRSHSNAPHHLLEVISNSRGHVAREVLTAMTRLPHPANVNEIWQTPPLNQRHRVTVYKLLKRFEAAGLVRRLHLQGQRHKFELVPVGGFVDYILCLHCQLLCELGSNDVQHLKAASEEQHPGWKITRHELKFYGVCPECLYPPASHGSLEVQHSMPRTQ